MEKRMQVNVAKTEVVVFKSLDGGEAWHCQYD
jgi:hypothetical protein